MNTDNTATRRSGEVIETPTRGELVVLPQSGRRLTVLKKRVKRSPLRRMSKKRTRESKTYSALRKAFLSRQIFCTSGINGCYRKATEVHHSKGRGRFYLDVSTFRAVCRPCHRWIEDHKREARKLGLITYR